MTERTIDGEYMENKKLLQWHYEPPIEVLKYKLDHLLYKLTHSYMIDTVN